MSWSLVFGYVVGDNGAKGRAAVSLTDETEIETGDPSEEGPVRKRRRPSRRAVWLTARGVFLVLMLPVVVVLLLPILMIGQEISAPNWITRNIEGQATEALGGGTLSFGDITVTVARDLHPTVRISEAELRDADGVVLARVPMIEGLLSPRGVIFNQEVMPQEIVLRGAQVGLRRSANGALAVAFDRTRAGEAQSLSEVLEQIKTTLDTPALAALETVRVEGLILNYDDARAGRSWVVDGGTVLLDTSDDSIDVSADFALLTGRSYVTTLDFSYSGVRGAPGAEMALVINDAPASDIALQAPALSWLSVLDAPVSAQIRARLDDDGALGPFHATLEIEDGALTPAGGASPVRFETAKTYLRYDPFADRVAFEQIELSTEWGELRAEGQAYLREFDQGLPGALLGQFRVIEMSVNPAGLYPEPLDLRQTWADFRLRLNPFEVEVGQFGAQQGRGEDAAQILGTARVAAGREGWRVDLDARIPTLDEGSLLRLWPESVKPRSRAWFQANLLDARIENVSGGLRLRPGQPARWAVSHDFEETDVRVLGPWPPVRDSAGYVTMQNNALTVSIDAGVITPPSGGGIRMAGSVFHIPEMGVPEAPSEITIRTDSSVTAALSLLDQPPFAFLSRAGREVDLAEGRARTEGFVNVPLMRQPPRDRVDFGFDVELRGMESATLVPGQTLAAQRLDLRIDPEGLQADGRVEVSGIPADAQWSQRWGTPGGRATAQIALGPAFLEAFNIALPPGMIGGNGAGTLTLDVGEGGATRFDLRSNLAGLTMQLPSLGWRKGASSRGELRVSGQLGGTPRIDTLALDVAGLQANGDVRLRDGGGLDRARFDNVRLGGWLNAGVELIGRGAGRPVGVEITGGTLDLRQANFGQGSGGGPMEIALDRLQVTDTIVLNRFRGAFDGGNGLNGQFSALLEGTAPISGTLAPINGQTGLRIVSDDAGAVLSAAGLLETALGGAMDLTLQPTGATGSYDGALAITNLRVRDAPALAALLDAVSVVGLLQQLDGQGLSFTNVDAVFRLTPQQIVVTQSSAVGPGLGISVDGVYTLGSKVMDFQGVISPFYLINQVGSVLTRPGEGLIGINFTLNGPAETVQVGVNPFSILTPGMFREIFRRPAPVVE